MCPCSLRRGSPEIKSTYGTSRILAASIKEMLTCHDRLEYSMASMTQQTKKEFPEELDKINCIASMGVTPEIRDATTWQHSSKGSGRPALKMTYCIVQWTQYLAVVFDCKCAKATYNMLKDQSYLGPHWAQAKAWVKVTKFVADMQFACSDTE